jgi:broad specificity phosphatase PhoE
VVLTYCATAAARDPHAALQLVSHVTPIKSLLRLALGVPPEAMFRFHLDTTSLSVVDHYDDDGSRYPVVHSRHSTTTSAVSLRKLNTRLPFEQTRQMALALSFIPRNGTG